MAASERQEIGALLEQLEAEERTISRLRRKLHDRIAIFTDTSGLWEEQEREISRKRRELHRQIDELLERFEEAKRAESSSVDITA